MIEKVIFDVDGVFSNGQFLYDEEGKKYKIFGAHDSDGIKLLDNSGIALQAITADLRGFAITKKRMDDIGLKLQVVAERDRVEFIKMCSRKSRVCFMGDGHYDSFAFDHAHYSIAPNNAVEIARRSANYVTAAKGGEGAVYEAALHLIKLINGDRN